MLQWMSKKAQVLPCKLQRVFRRAERNRRSKNEKERRPSEEYGNRICSCEGEKEKMN